MNERILQRTREPSSFEEACAADGWRKVVCRQSPTLLSISSSSRLLVLIGVTSIVLARLTFRVTAQEQDESDGGGGGLGLISFLFSIFGPTCLGLSDRCGLFGLAALMHKGIPGTAECLSKCSYMPILQFGYDCGSCGEVEDNTGSSYSIFLDLDPFSIPESDHRFFEQAAFVSLPQQR